jgi:hypothetical protein
VRASNERKPAPAKPPVLDDEASAAPARPANGFADTMPM